MPWPSVGVVGGGEACAAAQPTMGGGSRRSNQRWIWRLEQEDQRLKKHDGRWIDIQRLRLLESFVDNIEHAVPRTPARWTTARPRKGMTRRRRSHISGGMAWPAMGVVGGGEACAAAQPAMGGGSRRSRRRWIWRLEQEDQRLKKHDGRWIDTNGYVC